MGKKDKYLAFLILLIIFPIAIMGAGLYCCSYKRGFSINKISSKLPYNEMWDTQSLTSDEKEKLRKEILSQPFYYLSSGTQCYAFVSQDGKYVIKFFKMHKILPKKWLKDVPFSFFEKYRWESIAKKQNGSLNIFKSFKDAYEQLREESGLIYLHLNKKREIKKKDHRSWL